MGPLKVSRALGGQAVNWPYSATSLSSHSVPGEHRTLHTRAVPRSVQWPPPLEPRGGEGGINSLHVFPIEAEVLLQQDWFICTSGTTVIKTNVKKVVFKWTFSALHRSFRSLATHIISGKITPEYGREDSYNLWITLRWKGLFIIIISSDTHSGFGLIPGSTSICSPETAQVAEWRRINPPCAGLEICLLLFCWFLSTQAIRTKSHL